MAVPHIGPWYWERFTDGDGAWREGRGRPPGQDLAALRRGTNTEPGTEPLMWPFYTVELDDRYFNPASDTWAPPRSLAAEHVALVLYGHHQQSQDRPVHVRGTGIASAIRRLHTTNQLTEDAVDRRFFAAVQAGDINELSNHLRRLVQLLKGLRTQGSFDYTALVDDLYGWQMPERQAAVRRRWGLQYHVHERQADLDTAGAAADTQT